MIHQGDTVRIKSREFMVYGVVKRINWSNKAEVEWEGPHKITRMHDLSELERVDHNKEQLDAIYNQIPHLQNMTERWKDGRWVIARPIAAPELTLWSRIKNAWLVLAGKAFTVRWYWWY